MTAKSDLGLSLRSSPSANCDPLCDLEPNIGIVNVEDDRLEKLGIMNNSLKLVPASVSFVSPKRSHIFLSDSIAVAVPLIY